jgi:hypothetical protein
VQNIKDPGKTIFKMAKE